MTPLIKCALGFNCAFSKNILKYKMLYINNYIVCISKIIKVSIFTKVEN